MTTVHTLTLASHTENVQCEFHKKRAGNGCIESSLHNCKHNPRARIPNITATTQHWTGAPSQNNKQEKDIRHSNRK